MPAQSSFDYAIIRVVPIVEREEFVNAGVIVFCHERDFLRASIELPRSRLLAIDPGADVSLVGRHLDAIPRVCAGGADVGPIGRLSRRERWHWLVAPRSTIVQTSAAHSGLCRSPDDALQMLLERAVRPPPGAR